MLVGFVGFFCCLFCFVFFFVGFVCSFTKLYLDFQIKILLIG